jgi:large subunit ribosomal protein L13Ae
MIVSLLASILLLASRLDSLSIIVFVLQCHEGIPEPFDKMKRMVIPDALKVIRMKAERDFTLLKDLAQEFGWNYGPLVEKLEAQRQIKEQAYYAEKKANTALKAKAEKSVTLPADVTSTLAGI